jgi:hypothetical protein
VDLGIAAAGAVVGFTALPCVRSRSHVDRQTLQRLSSISSCGLFVLFRRFTTFDSFREGSGYPNTGLAATPQHANHGFGDFAPGDRHAVSLGDKFVTTACLDISRNGTSKHMLGTTNAGMRLVFHHI